MPRASWDSRRSASMCFACNTAEEAAAKLHQIAKEGYGIIYITERFCQELQEEMDRYVSERTPAIIPIPGEDGSTSAIGIAKCAARPWSGPLVRIFCLEVTGR